MHTDHTVTLHGQRFHYTEWGAPAAPPVVLLHGITGHARTWDDEARLLAERRRVLVLDQRGHGDSDPAPDGDYGDDALLGDLDAFVHALGLGRVSLLALSLGGRVAINYAGRYPARVERLVVVDIGPEIAPAGRARVGDPHGHGPRALRLDRGRDRPHARERPALHRRHAAPPGPARGAPAARRRLHLEVRPGPARRHPPGAHAGAGRPVAAVAGHRLPDLLVRGAESDVLSEETAKRMIDALPAAAAGGRAGRRPHRARRPAGGIPGPAARVPDVMSRAVSTVALVVVAVWIVAHVLYVGPVQEAAEATLLGVLGFGAWPAW